MKALLKKENMWDLIDKKIVPILFLIIIEASIFIIENFKIFNLKAQALMMMLVKDKFIKITSKIEDLLDTWQALKNIFEVGNSS